MENPLDDVRKAVLNTRDDLARLQSDLTAAKAEIEQLRGRVSEHEEEMALFMSVAVLICKQESDEWNSDRIQTEKDYAEVCGERIGKLSPVSAKAWLLRKQAEAFKTFVRVWRLSDEAEEWFTVSPEGLQDYAQSLRQQADELERKQ